MEIDIEKATKEFIKYTEQFDLKNDGIKRKQGHSLRVMQMSKKIAEKLKLDKQDIELATLIGLLHDIGRFEQYTNKKDVDHGDLGVEILNNTIRNYIDTDQYDEIIEKAIVYHSLYKIPNNLEPSLLKQVLLIRDSDKLDNFRVKNIESIQTLFSISDADFYSQRVSQNILKDIENHTLILKENRHNEVDMWVSYMAFVFDLNFKSSYLFIRENDYIHRNMERLHFTGDLKEDMLFVEKTCQSYIEEKCM